MMNFHTPASQFQINQEVFGAERAILARCMAAPDLISEASARLAPTDFEHEFLGLCFSALVDLHADGRKPSIEALVSIFGEDEIEAGLTVRRFLTDLLRGSLYGQFVPLADAVEVVRDGAQRRAIAKIGGDLIAGSSLTRPISETVATATAMLDDVSAAYRKSVWKAFDGDDLAAAAFAHMDGTERASPTTGLSDLDRILGGWPKGALSVIAGRPGMGKSAVAVMAIAGAAKKKYGCLFFSLEMSAKELGARMLCDRAFTHNDPIYYENILQRNLDDRHRRRLEDARGFIAQYPILVEEQRGVNVSEIAVRSRKVAAKFESDGGSLDVIFVDHMLLVKPSSRYAGNRVREVAEISDGLASLAKELNVSVVALCQLNRSVEGRDIKRPTLSDLRDSGSIEEDANNVTFIYRPAYYLEQTKAEGEAEIKRQEALAACRNSLEFIVAKNRNGRVGIVDAFVNIGANAVRDKAYGGTR
jgi:replicative DNA helicase